ncbi:GNAT family N-acetyltransferase [Pengzhenrongella sicca]|uniref:GNAT family N-acetyltransferase n=1 Tax=Pengzhenrongella sicca TaxID=2819238 RepID=A0A8A4ZG61_9MICO|nr:GNAT family N-acetyltransferase [Pengzhenrongella sicca]QTE29467.1 GNAT family N-acetyltransferase [Pengzhenrongella sicca]
MTDLTWPSTQPTLHADGLTLRPWRPSDAVAVYEACQDPEIVRWTTVPSPYLLEHAESYVGPMSATAWVEKTAANFAVTDDDGALVGSFGLVRMNPGQGVAEVGYWVAPAARRRGVARRAAAAVTEWALRDVGFPRVELLAAVDNAGSRRVAELIGFTLEGVLRSAAPGRTTRVDLAIHSRLPTD